MIPTFSIYQRAAICAVLGNLVCHWFLFDEEGPTEVGVDFFRHPDTEVEGAGLALTSLPASHQVFLRFAWAVWTGAGGPSALELFAHLDAHEQRDTLAGLLTAIAGGPKGIDEWLRQERPVNFGYDEEGCLAEGYVYRDDRERHEAEPVVPRKPSSQALGFASVSA